MFYSTVAVALFLLQATQGQPERRDCITQYSGEKVGNMVRTTTIEVPAGNVNVSLENVCPGARRGFDVIVCVAGPPLYVDLRRPPIANVVSVEGATITTVSYCTS